MTALSLAVVQIAMIATGADTYAEAHKTCTETGRPMVVLVGADWCPACKQMKDNVLPQVRQHGLLRRVAFALVNLDREKELGTQLTEGGPIPQLVMYRRDGDGWKLRRLIGRNDVKAVEKFIAQGIELDKADPAAEPAVAEQPANPDARAAQVQPVSKVSGRGGRRTQAR